MHSTLWERLGLFLLGESRLPVHGPLVQLGLYLSYIMFGILTIAILILLWRFFFRWGYEHIQIRRGRDSLGLLKRGIPGTSPPQGKRRRHRRLSGIRYRRRQ